MEIIYTFEKYLGSSVKLKNNENAFHCPFCHHHKPKLQINTKTNKFHCWVCNSGGNVAYLAKTIGMSGSDLEEILSETNSRYKNALKDTNKSMKEIIMDLIESEEEDSEENHIHLFLPSGFKSVLELKQSVSNPIEGHAIKYLKDRGLSKGDILKYNIGFTSEGIYKDRIIIPSYDENNKLNYFIARDIHSESRQKYKNPPVSKNIIAFENHLDWEEPLTLCEGAFDAISMKRNVTPLFGKFVSKKLDKKIIEKVSEGKLKEITIALDNDAKDDALKIYQKYNKLIPKIKLINFEEKDAGELKFKDILKYQKNSVTLSFENLIKHKLSFIK